MSNQFLKLRRSAVPGKRPDTGSLDLGEIALNTYDGLAFMKKSGSSGEEIIVIGNATGSFTGSFTGEFTGSLLGTASWAYNAVTASTADDFYVRGDITGSNALITGTITAQTLVVQTITSSVIYSSGSNIFGNKLTDTQEFTGSVTITGSLTSANVNLSGSFSGSFTGQGELTGSLFGTSSWALNSITASHAVTALSASYGITSSFALSGEGPFTGSFTGSFFGDGSGITNISASSVVGLNLSLIGSGSVTASTDPAYGFRVNSDTQISGSTQITGSLGVTGSVNISGSVGDVFLANVDTMIFTGSFYQLGSSYITGSINVSEGITGSLYGTASWAISSSYAQTASYALNVPDTASYALQALSSSYALTASYALEGTFPFTGSAKITGSLEVVGPITNTGVLTTNTFANPQTITSDIDIPAAYNAMLLGPVGIQETLQVGSGSKLIILDDLSNLPTTSSNTFNGKQTINGILSISGSQILSSRNNNVNTGNTVLLQTNKLTYIASFFDYAVYKGSDFRCGTVSTVWNPTTNVISYNDVTASYIGDTSGLTFSVIIVSDYLRLIATAASDGWTVNTMARVL